MPDHIRITSCFSGIPQGTIIEVIEEQEDCYIGDWFVGKNILVVEVPKRICEVFA